MNIKDAKKVLATVGVTIKRVDDEFRVNFVNGSESTAYFTDDLEDAIATGLKMGNDRRV